MEHNSKRRDTLSEQRPEQSIAEDDSSVSHPLRAQQQNPSDRLGDVDVESYGGVSPVMSTEKELPRFNRAIDPQYKFREIYAKAEVKPQEKEHEAPPVPEKQYSWIERMNKSAVKEEDDDSEFYTMKCIRHIRWCELTLAVDKPERAEESLVDKFIDFINAFGEKSEGIVKLTHLNGTLSLHI
jgi:hypothetical protein